MNIPMTGRRDKDSVLAILILETMISIGCVRSNELKRVRRMI